MNRFEKKAMVKRAFRALVKMAEVPKVYTGPSNSAVGWYLPDTASRDEILYNNAAPNSGKKYDYRMDNPPQNGDLPNGLLTALAANTNTYESEGETYPVGGYIRAGLPRHYKRPYGPLMNSSMADDRARRIQNLAGKMNPEYRTEGYLQTPELIDAWLNYYPQLKNSVDTAQRLNSLPDSINLEPQATPKSTSTMPASWNRQRMPKGQARNPYVVK